MFEIFGRHGRVALSTIFAPMVLVTALVAALSIPGVARAAFVVPPLTGPVVDTAGVLNSSRVAEISDVLRRLRKSGGPQINVVTVQSLEGLPIENASIQITDAWKLGDKKADDGVLFLVSMGDRKMRIEVGQGLEGVLTDAESKRIIEDRVLPYFRAGRAGEGILVGVRSILEKTAPDYLKALGDAPARPREAKSKRNGGLPLPVLVILFIFIMFAGGRRGRRSGLMGALAGAALGSSSRGGWSGRGGGGGGWSGGGGGFSGGGASGSW